MTNKLILLATCFFTALNVAAQTYSGGSGTENDPYLISSKADMKAIATSVLTGNFAVRNSSIVIGNLPAGVYLVKVGNEVKKFVKE
jgi:hypothetical protein